MYTRIQCYRELQNRLRNIQLNSTVRNSHEEERIIEEMSIIWCELTDEEREVVSNESFSVESNLNIPDIEFNSLINAARIHINTYYENNVSNKQKSK